MRIAASAGERRLQNVREFEPSGRFPDRRGYLHAIRNPQSAIRNLESINHILRFVTAMLTPTRQTADEFLDKDDIPEEEMRRSLRDLRRFNDLAGGTAAFMRFLRRAVPESSPPPSVLDLGTGTSDLMGAVRRRWPGSSVVGLDRNIRHLVYGREICSPAVARITADAMRLPFSDSAFDVVTSSHFFHHFSAEENVNILTDSLRVARKAVLVTDTLRHYAPLAFVKLLGALRLVGSVTRFDAPASVLQGYTIPEVRVVAEQTSASRFDLVNLFPYRFGLTLWK